MLEACLMECNKHPKQPHKLSNNIPLYTYYIYNDLVIIDALYDACKLIIMPTVCVATIFS